MKKINALVADVRAEHCDHSCGGSYRGRTPLCGPFLCRMCNTHLDPKTCLPVSLGDRMKTYEEVESQRGFSISNPVMARLDGRCYSRFTKNMSRPFDRRMVSVMRSILIMLMKKTQAIFGHTQSDELTLLFFNQGEKSQIFFDGRVQKMCSMLAGMASVYASRCWKVHDIILDHAHTFDCRVWQVPTKEEAVNTFIWREKDAVRNSIHSAASCFYSHAKLLNKNGDQMKEMLRCQGVNWLDYPEYFRRGIYAQRYTTRRKFTSQEITVLPPLHEARTNPDLEVERTDIRMSLPSLLSMKNRVSVVFDGEIPCLESEERS